MKLQTTIKTVCIAVALTASATASAIPFYLNLGTDYSPTGVKAGGPTTTGLIDEMTYRYSSHTTITDTNGNGIFDAGDAVVGTGGLLKAPGIANEAVVGFSNNLSRNQITDLSPTRASLITPTDPAGNGFKTNWFLSFGWDNLVGAVGATGGISYTSGTIRVFLFDPLHLPVGGGVGGAGGIEVMNFNVTGGGNNAIGQSLNLFGTMSVVNAASALGTSTVGALFNRYDGVSFGSLPVDSIRFENNQNTEPFFVNGNLTPASIVNPFTFYSVAGGTGTLEGIHDGSVTIPEPASLALVGLGLLGLGAIRRRKTS